MTRDKAAIEAALVPEDVAGLVERLRQYEGREWETTACYNGLRDEAAASLTRLSAGEPVAWQYRECNGAGVWSIWVTVPEDTALSYASENRTDRQVRPLYTAPQPAAVKVKTLDLSNLLRHAYATGFTAMGGTMESLDDWWPDYNPEDCSAYERVRSALYDAPDMAAELAAVKAERDSWIAAAHALSQSGTSRDRFVEIYGPKLDKITQTVVVREESKRAKSAEAEADRLRKLEASWENTRVALANSQNDLGTMRLECDRLRKLLDEAKGALRPFADVADYDIGDSETDADPYRPMSGRAAVAPITVGHLRAARAFLEKLGGRDA